MGLQAELFQSFLFWMLIRKNSETDDQTEEEWVSILLILDVDSEAAASLYFMSFDLVFQSFLFWMLIRKYLLTLIIAVRCRVSILLILDVDSEAGVLALIVLIDMGFNPSYSGCWFGSILFI